jgi:hypothetical protein
LKIKGIGRKERKKQKKQKKRNKKQETKDNCYFRVQKMKGAGGNERSFVV